MASAVDQAADPSDPPLPPHVPPDLVRPYAFPLLGSTVSVLPRTLIPAIHHYPPIFWVANVHRLVGGAWVPRRHQELQQIYEDTDHFTVNGTSGFAQMIGESWVSIPHETDPPLHSRYRLMLNPMFAPKRIAQLDDEIRRFARDLFTSIRPNGECEFVSEVAFEFPIRVFLQLMGLPQDEMPTFLQWEHDILRSADFELIAAALRRVTDYLVKACDDRRANPKDDLLTLAVQGEIDGRPLTEDELKGFCFNLFVGGLDTVSTNMANQFRHLAENPVDQARLRERPDDVPAALDELMRAYAAVTTLRLCKADTRVGDVEIKAGDLVLMPTLLAANDPEAFPEPETVDFDRKPRHLSFGYGPHLCIGLHLARREMRIAMEEALAMLPPFRIKPGASIESFVSGIVGPKTLPLVW